MNWNAFPSTVETTADVQSSGSRPILAIKMFVVRIWEVFVYIALNYQFLGNGTDSQAYCWMHGVGTIITNDQIRLSLSKAHHHFESSFKMVPYTVRNHAIDCATMSYNGILIACPLDGHF